MKTQSKNLSFTNHLGALVLASGLFTVGSSYGATITPITNSATAGGILTAAVLAPASGITVTPGSIAFQGTATPTFQQSATYTGFSLAPTSGSTPTLNLPNGILLTSGSANLPTTNTLNQFSNTTGSGSNALLSTLAGASTNDANALTFAFQVPLGSTSISAQFVFGTDEFPTQSVTDIFGFFVDGINYAKFPGGQLISNTPGNPTNFISNPVGSGLYGIEYNGLTNVFTVTGILDPNVTNHTLTIAIADTSDTIFDSGVFIGGLKTGTSTGGGGIGPSVPDGGTTLVMLGLALGGMAKLRKKWAI